MPIFSYISFEPDHTDPTRQKYNPALLGINGPRVTIEISIPDELMKYLTENSLPVPSPIVGSGLVDTGASITAVDAEAVAKLGIQPTGVSNVLTPSGSARQALYPIKLTFAGTNIALNYNNVLGSELKQQGIVALIGRDLLSHCVLVYNGKLGVFSLSI